MVRIYTYNDLRGFNNRIHNVKSNLCTWYYKEKKKYCGNYVSRKPPHGHPFNRRCWRHKRRGEYSASLAPVVLLMISASERFYNRDLWIKFLGIAEEQGIPLEFVLYHEDMLNCTVRNSQNLVSRYRPFPDLFGKVLKLRNSHGSVAFTQICNEMLEYGCKIPHAGRCILLTERTIPIRSPLSVYRKSIASACNIDINYNVRFKATAINVPQRPRGHEFPIVNNLCQGLYTVEFLRVALPTLPLYCENFGISLNNGVYNITNPQLFRMWQDYTGANPSEFWLTNSFVIHIRDEPRPMGVLKSYMDRKVVSDKYVVAEVPEWRGGWKRTFVFRDWNRLERLPHFDHNENKYYTGLNIRAVSLKQIIRFIRREKKRALFFRQVELP